MESRLQVGRAIEKARAKKSSARRWWRIFRGNPVWLMFAVFVGGIGIAWALTKSGRFGSGSLGFEGAKMALQVSVVGVAGALLSFAAENYKRRQERVRYREEFLKDTLKRITSSYNKSKSARRLARAKALTGLANERQVKVAGYDESMRELNDAQLELEAVKRDLKIGKDRFPSNERIERYAEAMEKYLGEIIKEYETERQKFGDEKTPLPLKHGGEFASFVDQESKAGFKIYSKPHGQARDAINRELLALASAKDAEAASHYIDRKLRDEEAKALASEWVAIY